MRTDIPAKQKITCDFCGRTILEHQIGVKLSSKVAGGSVDIYITAERKTIVYDACGRCLPKIHLLVKEKLHDNKIAA